MSNDLITIIYHTDKMNLGVTPLFYHWLKEPLWQYFYNMFQPYSDSVTILGLDVSSDNENPLVDIKQIVAKTQSKRVLLVDMSLVMVTETTINNFLNANFLNVIGVKKENSNILIDGSFYDKEYYKFLGFDIVEAKALTALNPNSFCELYASLNKAETKYLSLPYDESFKLSNKKDAIILKHLNSL